MITQKQLTLVAYRNFLISQKPMLLDVIARDIAIQWDIYRTLPTVELRRTLDVIIDAFFGALFDGDIQRVSRWTRRSLRKHATLGGTLEGAFKIVSLCRQHLIRTSLLGIAQQVPGASDGLLAVEELCDTIITIITQLHEDIFTVQRHSDTQHQQQITSNLRDILVILNADSSIDDVLHALLSQAMQLFKADAGIIHQFDTSTSSAIAVTAIGVPSEVMALGKIPLPSTAYHDAIVIRPSVLLSNLARSTAEHSDDSVGWENWFVSEDPDIIPQMQPLQTLMKDLFSAVLAIPLVIGDEVYGVLELLYAQKHSYSEIDFELAVAFSDQAALAIENVRLRQRIEQSAIEEERQRLARELHDSVAQLLHSLSLFTTASRRMLKSGNLERLEQCLLEMSVTNQQITREMRLLLYELRPPVLEQEGLVELLRARLDAVEKRAGVKASFLTEGSLDVPHIVQTELYRIAIEALNNSLKHATASEVSVHIYADNEHIEVEVVDNGCGFDLSIVNKQHGMGLVTMRERAELLGGMLAIQSIPTEGTRVKVQVPVQTTENRSGLL